MCVRNLCAVFCYFVFTSSNANGQVCTRRVVVPTTKIVTRQWTYRETYRSNVGFCPNYDCRFTRMAVKTVHLPITTKSIQTQEYCCTGFIRRETPENSSILCEPICMPNCVNGYCKSPGQCACLPGYTPDLQDEHRCLPICQNTCINGACIAPDTCLCNFGFSSINGLCTPICTESCVNAACTAPETCTCDAGFKKSDLNICEADCPRGCSECDTQGNCMCSESYSFVNGTCVPVCNLSATCPCAQNGTIISDCAVTPYINVSEVDERYEDDEATDVTELTSTEASTDVELNDTLTADAIEFSLNYTIYEEDTQRSPEIWVLAVSALGLLVLIAAITAVTLKWKYIYIYFKGGSYVTEEDHKNVSDELSQFETVKISEIDKSDDEWIQDD